MKKSSLRLVFDLEGTLIGNQEIPVVRPAAYDFLEWCRKYFSSLGVMTTVKENVFRKIALKLVREKQVPGWFAEIDYVSCLGSQKDLRYVPGWPDVLLIDDYPGYMLENQKSHWLRIKTFDPYNPDSNDCELRRVALLLVRIVQNDFPHDYNFGLPGFFSKAKSSDRWGC